MATSGPVEIAELAERLKMAPATLEKHLLALEAKGLIFRGHFTPRRPALGATRGRAVTAGAATASPEQWCDRYNLEKIHRLTLNRLRAETEPCADHEYAAFRLRWNHVGGAGIAADQSGVAAVLEQLSGVALSPELWERAILPARIPGYRPEWLDLLCLGGEVVWAAVPGEDAADEVPARITFLRRRRAGAARSDEAAAECRRRRIHRPRRDGVFFSRLPRAVRNISTSSPSAPDWRSGRRSPRYGGSRPPAASPTTASRRCACCGPRPRRCARWPREPIAEPATTRRCARVCARA